MGFLSAVFVLRNDLFFVKWMRYWALQYGPSVEILEPESLRNQIISDMKDMMKRYSDI